MPYRRKSRIEAIDIEGQICGIVAHGRSDFAGDAAIGDLFQVPQPRLFLADVVPGSRNRVELLSKLDLEHHQTAVTEPRFAGGRIENSHIRQNRSPRIAAASGRW